MVTTFAAANRLHSDRSDQDSGGYEKKIQEAMRDTRKVEKNGKTCSTTESDSDTEVKVSSLHSTYFQNIFFNGY